MSWDTIIQVFRLAAVMAAAAIIGSWFLREVKKSRMKNQPWYKPYLSIPGVLILVAISLPIVLWLASR